MKKNSPDLKDAVALMGVVGNLFEKSANLFGIWRDIIVECQRASTEIEHHRTEQARIVSETAERIERIRAQRDVFISFLDQHFAERRSNFEQLFARLDQAMANGDANATKTVLDTMVELAKTSPFEQLRDAASAHKALANKDTIWEFLPWQILQITLNSLRVWPAPMVW
jgi:hypothetical protein